MMMRGKQDRAEEEEEEAEEGYAWSELPGELLALVNQRLIKLRHRICFRAVCKRWRKQLAEMQPILFNQSSLSPLLMLPYCGSSSNCSDCEDADCGCGIQEQGLQCRLFLDMAGNRYHHIDFVEGFEKIYCRGSAFGWLFMLQHIPLLLNPLTGKQIALPPISSFSDMLEYNPERVGHEYLVQYPNGWKIGAGKRYLESMYMERVVMSADPATSKDDCIILAIRNNSNTRLAFCKPGADKWTLIPNPDGHPSICFRNTVFWRNQFYAVDTKGKVLCCDLSNDDAPRMSFLAADVDIVTNTFYLLVGPADELMMVTRSYGYERNDNAAADEEEDFVDDDEDYVYNDDYVDDENYVDDDQHREVDDRDVSDEDRQLDPLGIVYLTDLDSDGEVESFGTQNYWTTGFMVYRLNEDTHQWEHVRDIGDFAFFLGFNAPICRSTKDYPGFKSNCIYFTDDHSSGHRRRRFGGHDMGIYNLSNGSVESILSSNLYKHTLIWPPPVWILP
ncbi:unnamed protein product [Linum trigynum]|uniref:KIB1-4 beta-propeller domain-containing protein n=1 Tax=Linum trigynum TaxID=586398 RepID=A0AAV2G687_9ROSI